MLKVDVNYLCACVRAYREGKPVIATLKLMFAIGTIMDTGYKALVQIKFLYLDDLAGLKLSPFWELQTMNTVMTALAAANSAIGLEKIYKFIKSCKCWLSNTITVMICQSCHGTRYVGSSIASFLQLWTRTEPIPPACETDGPLTYASGNSVLS